MNLCSEGHDEVCYEGRECPVCFIKADLQYEINLRDIDIEKLNNEIDKLNNILDSINNQSHKQGVKDEINE